MAASTIKIRARADAAPLRVRVAAPGAGLTDAALRWLARQTRAAARALRMRGGELSLALVRDRRMAQLHREFCGVAGTTDVLTFDLRDPRRGPTEAEIVLCVDEAARQAQHLGHSLRAELLLYVVHGLLHLAGHDDHEPRAAAAMHRAEDRLLTRLGVGAVYARAPRRARA